VEGPTRLLDLFVQKCCSDCLRSEDTQDSTIEGTLTVRRTSMVASCVAVYFDFIAVGTFLIFGIATRESYL
jgi:hypothetical protein